MVYRWIPQLRWQHPPTRTPTSTGLNEEPNRVRMEAGRYGGTTRGETARSPRRPIDNQGLLMEAARRKRANSALIVGHAGGPCKLQSRPSPPGQLQRVVRPRRVPAPSLIAGRNRLRTAESDGQAAETPLELLRRSRECRCLWPPSCKGQTRSTPRRLRTPLRTMRARTAFSSLPFRKTGAAKSMARAKNQSHARTSNE